MYRRAAGALCLASQASAINPWTHYLTWTATYALFLISLLPRNVIFLPLEKGRQKTEQDKTQCFIKQHQILQEFPAVLQHLTVEHHGAHVQDIRGMAIAPFPSQGSFL